MATNPEITETNTSTSDPEVSGTKFKFISDENKLQLHEQPRRAGENNCSDFITILTANRPINKEVTINNNGLVSKKSNSFSNGMAVCIYVDNIDALEAVISTVQNDPNSCICLGFHPNVWVGKQYEITTVSDFNKLKKASKIQVVDGLNNELYEYNNAESGCYITTRTKAAMAQSSFVLFDKDDQGDNDFQIWRGNVTEFVYGFDSCDTLFIPSASARIKEDGDKSNSVSRWHCYLKIDDPEDISDLGYRILTAAHAAGYGSHVESSAGKALSRCIIDHSVFSSERVIYEGCPIVHGNGYHVADYAGFVIRGPQPSLDTSKIKTVEGIFETKSKIIETRSPDGSLSKRNNKYHTIKDHNSLKTDTMVEYKTPEGTIGSATLEKIRELYKDYSRDRNFKLRCQIPSSIRSSNSMNGILNFDSAGNLFLYDNGTSTVYSAPWAAIAFKEAGAFKLDINASIIKTETPVKKLSDSARKLCEKIIRRTDEKIPNASDYLCIDSIVRIADTAFYSASKNKVFCLNNEDELIINSISDFIRILPEIYGQLLDRSGIKELYIEKGITDDIQLNKLVNAVIDIALETIRAYLLVNRQRDKLVTEVDLFAKNSKLKIEIDRVVYKAVHHPFSTDVTVDLANRTDIITDYKSHFPMFDGFLNLLLAGRSASDRRTAFYLMQAISGWGKGFLIGVLKDLGIVAELSVQEIEKAITGAPFGKDMSTFQRAWVLVIDEFKSPKGDLKLLNSEISYSPKNQLSCTSSVYMKLFTYAEDIDALQGEYGVESQFGNRFSYIEVTAGTLDDRNTFQRYGKSQYRHAVSAYTAEYLNKYVENLRSMGRHKATQWGDKTLENYHSTHRIDVGNSLSDGINNLSQELVALIRETMNEPHGLNNPSSELGRLKQRIRDATIIIENTEQICFYFVKSVASIIDGFLNTKATRSEITKVSHKRSSIAMAADYEGKSYQKTRTLPDGSKVKGLLILKEVTTHDS